MHNVTVAVCYLVAILVVFTIFADDFLIHRSLTLMVLGLIKMVTHKEPAAAADDTAVKTTPGVAAWVCSLCLVFAVCTGELDQMSPCLKLVPF